MFWVIIVKSNRKISESKKDLIVDLIDTEAHHTIKNRFILHDVLEDNNFSEIIIEGSRIAAINLKEMLKSNLPYNIL